jgi:hypothetical protein
MKLFVVVNNVEGSVNGVYLRATRRDAIDFAVGLAAEQCDTGKDEIRTELRKDFSFKSPNGDIIVTVHECEVPAVKPATPEPHRLTVRVPVEVAFSTDPKELDDRETEPKPTRRSLVAYLKAALRLDVDIEGEGQPEGAVFAAAGVDWGKAELLKG